METPEPPAEHPYSETPLFQFRLRHMLLAVAGVSVLLALLMSLEGQGRLVLMVTLGILAGHVSATLIGLRLRQHSERRRVWQHASGITDLDELAPLGPSVGTPVQSRVAPNVLRSTTTRLGWLPLLVAAGALFGGFGGGWLLAQTVGQRITVAGIVLGAVSSGVLGAWLAFVLGGFIGVSRHAWQEAVRDKVGPQE